MEQTQKENKTLLTLSWSTPQILPGPGTPLEQTSTSGPSATVFSSDNNTYVAFRQASNDSIWISHSANGETWSKNDTYAVQKTLSATEIDTKVYTLHRPSITNYNSALYLAFTNKSNNTISVYKSSTPTGSAWSLVGGGNVPIPSTPLGGPSIASFNNGRLYLAYTDTTNKVMVGNYDVGTNSWSTFYSVQKSSADIKSSDSPFLWSVTSGSIYYRLYLCIRAINETYIGYATIDSNGDITSWSSQASDPVTPFSIVETPQVAQYNNDFYMTVVGPKNDIKYGVSSDEGQNWSLWNTIDNVTTGSPALCKEGSNLVMAFTQDNRNPLKAYVMSTYGQFS